MEFKTVILRFRDLVTENNVTISRHKDMIDKKIIEKQLKKVIDPEIGVSIVDMGLIYEIKENGLKFKYILMGMILFIIIVNTVQFFENADLNLIAGTDFIFLIFFSFISLVHFLITRKVKKDLKKKFEEIFEIN